MITVSRLQNKLLYHFSDIVLLVGQMVTGLVREFMEFFNLEYSLAVFEPETGCVSTGTTI